MTHCGKYRGYACVCDTDIDILIVENVFSKKLQMSRSLNQIEGAKCL